ncbi:DUF5655 domain-containing protein [Kitasatospora sp. NPDC098663]|uniref:DUF5655 domain-containing protein n=1 Tax=Kitasatospora sp. NPDC098663 TaxID=3364096 RepID=UPI0038172BF7
MTLRIFRTDHDHAVEVAGSTVALERHLQTYIERNMAVLLGVRFLDSEVSTGSNHGGRIDSLGLDEDGCPVVVEYKRGRDENVISQALFYMSWVRDHQADFESLVAQKLGSDVVATVDWTSPRIVCVAADFSRYDLHAVREIGRRIDLVRYRRFGDGLLALDLVTSTADAGSARTARSAAVLAPATRATVAQRLAGAADPVRDLYGELDGRLLDFGDVHSVELRHYIAYRRGGNFATMKILSNGLRLFLRLDPRSVTLEEGFTRDVSEVGHHGTGDLEVRICSVGDLDRAMPLLRASYEAVG